MLAMAVASSLASCHCWLPSPAAFRLGCAALLTNATLHHPLRCLPCSVTSEEMPLSTVPLAAKKLDDRWAWVGSHVRLGRLATAPLKQLQAYLARLAPRTRPHLAHPSSALPFTSSRRWSPTSSLTDIYAPSAAPLPARRGGLTSLFGLAPAYISLAAKSE